MIFVTVGSQLPFDRLITTVDEWSQQHPEFDILAQIGLSHYQPKAMRFKKTMTPNDYHEAIQSSDLIIAHAGMGTIISALELGKPLLLMPRLAEQGEHRNDHQIATIKQMTKKFPHIVAAYNKSELLQKLENFRIEKLNNPSPKKESLTVSQNLIEAIKSFITTGLS